MKDSAATKPPFWQEAIKIFFRLSGWVIIPLLAGVLIGRRLDAARDSSPRWFFIITGIAFVVSTIGLVIQARREYAGLSAAEDKDDKKDSGGDTAL